jgi:hypothetical protein
MQVKLEYLFSPTMPSKEDLFPVFGNPSRLCSSNDASA